MSQLLRNLTIIDVEELVTDPTAFTVQDIISIARLLKKSPTEVFEIILNGIKEEEYVARELEQ